MCLNMRKERTVPSTKMAGPGECSQLGRWSFEEWNKEISLMRNEQITIGVRSNKLVFEYS